MNVIFDKCSDALSFASENKSFGLFYSTENNPNLNIHTHECCEILLCLKGGKTFLIDDKVYSIKPGDIFIINQFEAHKITFETETDVERFAIQIHPEFIFSLSSKDSDLSQCFYLRNQNTTHCISLNNADINYIKGLFNTLSKTHSFGDDIIKTSIMAQLLAFVNDRFLNSHQTVPQQQNIQLKKAIIYINEHLSEELTLEKIAKNSYISVNQLCKLFKATFGTTVMKYIIGKRISNAKKLLKNGHSVSDTAFLCGFGDYSNFIRTFTKSVGISPGQYKKSTQR